MLDQTTEILEENEALKLQHGVLRDLLRKAQEEANRNKQRVDQLAAALQEKDRRISELQQAEYRIKKLEQTASCDSKTNEAQAKIQTLQNDKQQLEIALAETQQKNGQLERVISFLRQKAETAHLETLQLRTDLQTSEQAVAALTQKNDAACAEKDLLRQQLHLEIVEKLKEEIKLLKQEIGLQGNLEQELHQLHDDHIQKDKQMQQMLLESSAILKEKQRFEESLQASHRLLEAKEQEIKMVQHHLAKKVRETALMADKCEEQRLQIVELQKNVAESNAKSLELQRILESQSQQEKRLQEQLYESMKSSEAQTTKWEDKYFQLHHKYQEAETRIRELQTLEEKQAQMQKLLLNLSSLTGTIESSPAKLSSSSIYSDRSQALNFENPSPISDTMMNKENNSDLLNSPPFGIRYKQTLFD